MATRAKADNGEGAIVRDGDGWKCQWTLKGPDGKAILNERGNVRRPLVRGRTKEEVRAERDRIKREAAAGRGLRAKTITAAYIVDLWMKGTGRDKEPSTLEAYRGAYRNYIAKYFTFPAESCTGAKVNDTIREKVLPSIKRNKDGSNTGRATAKRVFNMVYAAMDWASSSDRPEPHLKFNPMTGASLGNFGKEGKRDQIRIEDAMAIIAAAEGQPSQLVWRLLFRTGMRRGEALGLNVRHVDLDRREITVEQIATPESGGRYVSRRTKGKEPRIVPFPPDLYDDLAQLIAGRGPDEALFAGPRSPRLLFATLRVWFQRDMKAAGVQGYTIHQFRHSFASNALLHEMAVIVLAKILGHNNVNITWNTYGHVLAGTKNDAIDALAASIALPVATKIANESTELPSFPVMAGNTL